MFNTRIRTATVLSAIAVGASLLSACDANEAAPAPSATTSEHAGHGATGGAPSSGAAVTAAFNDADVDFATMMYPHHAQAIDMANLVDGKGASADVVAIANEIKGAQQPEMDAFTRLLKEWGKAAPSASMAHAMDGMMTRTQMAELKSLRGAEFDRAWLTMMIEHHKGAVSMSETELAKGINPENRKIAEAIKTGQQAEIARMQTLL